MDNLSLILVIFLIAALNTFVVTTAVRLIFKIKVDKHEVAEQVKKEISAASSKVETVELKRTDILQEIPKVEVEKKELPKKEESKLNI